MHALSWVIAHDLDVSNSYMTDYSKQWKEQTEKKEKKDNFQWGYLDDANPIALPCTWKGIGVNPI